MLKIIILILLLAHGCISNNQEENKQVSQQNSDTNIHKKSWQQSYDFDEDQKIDSIFYTYSGGAHCCYTLSIKLSSNQERTEIPYLIEGGYLGGLDLSQPDNFNIFDIDKDKRTEIFIRALPDDASLQDRYVDFEKRSVKSKYFNEIKYKKISKK